MNQKADLDTIEFFYPHCKCLIKLHWSYSNLCIYIYHDTIGVMLRSAVSSSHWTVSLKPCSVSIRTVYFKDIKTPGQTQT